MGALNLSKAKLTNILRGDGYSASVCISDLMDALLLPPGLRIEKRGPGGTAAKQIAQDEYYKAFEQEVENCKKQRSKLGKANLKQRGRTRRQLSSTTKRQKAVALPRVLVYYYGSDRRRNYMI